MGRLRLLTSYGRLIARFRSGERGFILILTQSALVLGTTVAAVTLVGTAAQLRSGRGEYERESAYFTAKAAMEVAFADMVQGKDLLSPGYQAPQVQLNQVEASVAVSGPLGSFRPKPADRYLDPGTKGGLADLGPGESWTQTLEGVQPFSTVGVNWAFGTAPQGNAKLELVVEDSDGIVVGKVKVNTDRSPVQLFVRAGPGTTYVVRFKNTSKPDDKDAVAAVSKPFSSQGGSGSTWVRAQMAGRPYVLTATSGGFTLKAYVQQIPGPNQAVSVPQLVVVESWQRGKGE